MPPAANKWQMQKMGPNPEHAKNLWRYGPLCPLVQTLLVSDTTYRLNTQHA